MSLEDAIMQRRRAETAERATESTGSPDVIPLLDGWIRRIERQSGSETPKRD